MGVGSHQAVGLQQHREVTAAGGVDGRGGQHRSAATVPVGHQYLELVAARRHRKAPGQGGVAHVAQGAHPLIEQHIHRGGAGQLGIQTLHQGQGGAGGIGGHDDGHRQRHGQLHRHRSRSGGHVAQRPSQQTHHTRQH